MPRPDLDALEGWAADLPSAGPALDVLGRDMTAAYVRDVPLLVTYARELEADLAELLEQDERQLAEQQRLAEERDAAMSGDDELCDLALEFLYRHYGHLIEESEAA